MNRLVSLCLLLFVLFISCAKKTTGESQVYNNNFESANLEGITGGIISTFNGTHVLGNYNNSGFNLTLNDLPDHDLVDITFDLYIHDSWEGVQQIQGQPLTGPDIWQLKADNKTYINTTFANFDCQPGNFCPPQSYPADYPSQSNNPKTGAAETDLPGFCSEATNPKGTTLYKIHKSIMHSGKSILISCLDQLKQEGIADPKCDESWSVDNIQVKVISLN